MLLIQKASEYICNVFKWSELVGFSASDSGRKTKAQDTYLKHVKLVRNFDATEVMVLFKKLKHHPDSRYWNHYLLFRYFLTAEQQMTLLHELLQEEQPEDATYLIEELGKWSPDFQRRFLSDLDEPVRNLLFKPLGPMQLIELSLSLTNAIYDHPNIFCERYT